MKALKQIFCMSVISVLGQVHCVVVTAQCSSSGYEISILGWKLQGHIYKTMEANSPLDCLFACREDDRCQSFNWVISLHLCEFNNRTKEARSEDFVSDPNRFYFRRYKNRGKKVFKTILPKKQWLRPYWNIWKQSKTCSGVVAVVNSLQVIHFSI